VCIDVHLPVARLGGRRAAPSTLLGFTSGLAFPEQTMNFGALYIATLWRLARAESTCQAIVLEGANGLRLVIVKAGRIVQWEHFPVASLLRVRAAAIRRECEQAGWLRSTSTPAHDVRAALQPRLTL
jgi:hypothetical protein